MGNMAVMAETRELGEVAEFELILEALGRATATPSGLPLFASRKGRGLFPATPAGRGGAQTARDSGWLRALRSEKRGRFTSEICTITQEGFARLLDGDGASSWRHDMLAYLARWQAKGSSGDCALPALYGEATTAMPHLSLGLFHDGLRGLHEQQRIYLHPWTGPLCEIPRPECALLVGHEIAYYASLREPARAESKGEW